jgi:diguanylate cyclase (GGDEF)-like protein/PAS domain S-box-containing protein
MIDAAPQTPSTPLPKARVEVAPALPSRFVRRLKMGILALNLMVLSLLALTLHDSRQHLIAEATITANNLTGLLATNLVNLFDKIDQSLLSVVDKLNDDGVLNAKNRTELQAFMARQAFRLSEVDRIAFSDAQGNLTYPVGAVGPERVNIKDRDYFKALRDHPGARLVFSAPLISRATNEATMVLARGIHRHDGTFLGIVIAPITLSHLTHYMAVLDTGRNGFVSLVDKRWNAIARYPATVDGKGIVGNSVETPERLRMQGISPAVGTLFETSPLDQVPRTIAYRQVSDYPFYVFVGLDRDDYLAGWWRNVIKMSAFLALFVVVTTGFGRAAVLAWRRLQQQEKKFRTVLESSPDPLILTEPNGKIAVVNRQVETLFGYPAHELLGQPIETLIPPRFRHTHVALREDYLLQPSVRGMADDRDLWALTKSGVEVPVSIRLSPISTGSEMMVAASIRDVSERKAANEKIAYLAYHDALTELPNRRLLLERLQHALAASARTGNTAALLFFDLDHFKTLNDTLGHDRGDMLLCQVAQRTQTCVREVDTLARLGGDEFVVLFEGLSESTKVAASQAEALAEKIRHALDHPYLLDEQPVISTASIGVTLITGQNTAIAELMKQADLAMYQAKKAGRNTVQFFDPQMQQMVSDRAALESDLRKSIERKQLVLHYQPQVDAQGQLTGAEALLRWPHGTRGMVPPAEFIPLAEESGLIQPLGQWVLETACAQLAQWAEHPATNHLSLAVNISASQLLRDDFVEQVTGALAHTGANPLKLKLELTESVLVSDMESTIVKMVTLKQAGVRFSLDDFGTGFSSLAYLKRLPLDQLKIDKSFVDELLTDPNDAAIAQMILALAGSMGLNVIAEGVETDEQRGALAGMGCMAYQGYLYSHPLPLDAFEAYAHQAASTEQGHAGP